MNLDNIVETISRVWRDDVLQRLPVLLQWAQNNRSALYIVCALLVGFAIGRSWGSRATRLLRASAYQNRGEALLSRIAQASFGYPDYHLMNHVTLKLIDGTTQIDHILVSRYGVFVIETKDYKGWIFADANHAKWTQVLFSFRFKFQNPIFQNSRHVRAVRSLLDFLPPSVIEPVVVFTGDAEFKTEVPPGVFDISGFIDYVRGQTAEVMSLNRVQFCVGRLETARLAISGRTDVEHIRSLERRQSSWI